ncbi:tRNA N(3)-methylcytidine methyltransferase METTL6 [Synchiropus splendidus]|uniref:tRNA N(3)-methylcytidine methyltransferase METTL6 n=1 Tax=Synchiropus splendidus TaxID=270530 RepID=UPI00237D6B34|nr:tRNA N(3)-methylcytidine methyltransferase METTL6 [Synchiropus splendidus]
MSEEPLECVPGGDTESSVPSPPLTLETHTSAGEGQTGNDSGPVLVSAFKQMKLEKDAQKNWDLFYKRNSTNFFKDRHWTTREFQELRDWSQGARGTLVLLEAGCGVGNCIFPLLQDGDLNVFVYACDFSPRAIDFVKKNPLFCSDRCRAFTCDLTREDLRENVPEAGVDVVTLIFVLSAVHPDKMKQVVVNISRVLKPGGAVLFRDYGVHDHAMKRFKSSSKLGDNLYVRQDGTRSYFFSKDFLAQMFTESGFLCVANDYVMRETINRKEGLNVPRVFLQSKFIKTANHSTAEHDS